MSVTLVEDFDGFEMAMRQGAYESLDTAAVITKGSVQKQLSKHGVATGVAKKFGVTDKARSSEPGQPPGLRTGTLRRSIQIDRSQNKGDRPFVLTGSNLVYSRIHELGGPHHPKRPYLLPGLRVSADPVRKAIAAIFRKAIKNYRGVV